MPQDQAPLGEIKVSDMIGEDTVIAEDGKVYGPVNYIKNFEDFSDNPEEQYGNFFPIQLSDEYEGETIVLKRDGEQRKEAQDLDWIIRINSPENIYSFETKEKRSEIIRLDFSTAKIKTPEVGEVAISVPPAGTDMDAIKDSSKLIGDNAKIKWTGTDGKVTGNIHWYHFGDDDNADHFTDAPYGHYFPIVIKHYDGEEITTIGSKDQEVKKVDPKWIIRVDDFVSQGKKAVFKWKDTVLASLDFSKATLDPPPVNRVVIPRTDDTKHGNSFGKPVSQFSTNLVLDEKGKMTGTLKYVTDYQHDFPEENEHEGNWLLLHFDKDAAGTEDIKCGINNIVDTDKGDFNTNFKLTQDKLAKPVIVEINQGAIRYEIDISELQLDPKGDV